MKVRTTHSPTCSKAQGHTSTTGHSIGVRSILFLIASTCLKSIPTLAYDIGCLYPEEMPAPFSARGEAAASLSSYAIRNKMETPIIVYLAHIFTECQSNCIAYHDDTALSTITMKRAPFSTPSKNFNSWSRALCIMQCHASTYESGPFPNLGETSLRPLFDSWNLKILPLSQELVSCNHEPGCLHTVVKESDFDPRIIGQVVHLDIVKSQSDDGWNFFGQKVYDVASDSVVECSANCAPFSDITGYVPRDQPTRQKKGKKESKTKKTKKKGGYKGSINVADTNEFWQPLFEIDGNGNFHRQDHVVPHIGYTGKPKLVSQFKKASVPRYNYEYEAELVVKRLQQLVGNDEYIEMLRFFDNKLTVRAFIQLNMLHQFGSDMKFEDYCMFIAGIDAAEYDSILQVWREKVRFDRVRPTTVIQQWGDKVINTYNGNPSSTQPADIHARDFQSFIRVMPHSEYPSGSASICTAYAEFTDLYVKEFHDTDNFQLLPMGPNAFNYGCDSGRDLQFGCGAPFHVQNMTKLAEICGESRLWGGMHFTHAIEAGHEIASGLGELAVEFVKTIKAGSNWTSSTNLVGSDRPSCEGSK